MEAKKRCLHCRARIDESETMCDLCKEKFEIAGVDPTTPNKYVRHSVLATSPYPMNWYKFLIYFSLWAGAFLNLHSAGQYSGGNIYRQSGLIPSEVYAAFPMLELLDMAFMGICTFLGLYCIYTRFELAKLKANGPKCLYTLYSAMLISEVAYIVASYLIVGVEDVGVVFAECLVTIIVRGIFLLCNYLYFSKRASLFKFGAVVGNSNNMANATTTTLSDSSTESVEPVESAETDNSQQTEIEPQRIQVQFCRKCGRNLGEKEKFCGKCGTEVRVVEQ